MHSFLKTSCMLCCAVLCVCVWVAVLRLVYGERLFVFFKLSLCHSPHKKSTLAVHQEAFIGISRNF